MAGPTAEPTQVFDQVALPRRPVQCVRDIDIPGDARNVLSDLPAVDLCAARRGVPKRTHHLVGGGSTMPPSARSSRTSACRIGEWSRMAVTDLSGLSDSDRSFVATAIPTTSVAPNGTRTRVPGARRLQFRWDLIVEQGPQGPLYGDFDDHGARDGTGWACSIAADLPSEQRLVHCAPSENGVLA